MALSQQDLEVRLQKTGCCVGHEAKRLAQYYLYGSECAEEQLQKVTILNAYLDILSCYKVQATTATNWIYVIDLNDITLLGLDSTIEIYIGGELIVEYIIISENICNELDNIVTAIKANSNIIDATFLCEEGNYSITITANCDMKYAYARSYSMLDSFSQGYFPIYTEQEGKCITGDADNCITEEQINKIVENIAIMCKDCFKPAGFAYYNK